MDCHQEQWRFRSYTPLHSHVGVPIYCVIGMLNAACLLWDYWSRAGINFLVALHESILISSFT